VEVAPTCYRHPDRETYVRCTRCDRPICPDCMRAASVGFQCPDDVAAGSRTTREARTPFGGRLSGDTSKVSIALIAINVAVFFLGPLLAGGRDLAVAFGNLAGPVTIDTAGTQGGVAAGQYYRLLTAAFLHAGVFHLAMNMFALASLGPALESALGRARYLALYVLSALGGSVLSFVLTDPRLSDLVAGTAAEDFLPGIGQLGVGASGAIFGLFGAYYVVVRRLGGETRSIVILLAVNLVITFTIPIIDWRAHLGGLLVGAAIATVFAHVPRGPRRSQLQAAGCAAMLALLVVLVAVRSTVV
jgi:membrane associated rhomboid family serine protease